MKRKIAKTLGIKESAITMKPKGYARIGMERLFCIMDKSDGMITDILESANKEDNYINLIELKMYPFQNKGKDMILMELPMSHLNEYTEEEING